MHQALEFSPILIDALHAVLDIGVLGQTVHAVSSDDRLGDTDHWATALQTTENVLKAGRLLLAQLTTTVEVVVRGEQVLSVNECSRAKKIQKVKDLVGQIKYIMNNITCEDHMSC